MIPIQIQNKWMYECPSNDCVVMHSQIWKALLCCTQHHPNQILPYIAWYQKLKDDDSHFHFISNIITFARKQQNNAITAARRYKESSHSTDQELPKKLIVADPTKEYPSLIQIPPQAIQVNTEKRIHK
jgi:hypothetical protein